MEEDIKNILEAGIQAPSGSNFQPRKFKINGNQVDIFALPEKDHPILNFRNRGTLFAHGALFENILIAADALGYKSECTLFPDQENKNCTARITFSKADPKNQSLFSFISKRSTNRKPYKKEALSDTEKNVLARCAAEISNLSGVRLKMIEDKNKLEELGRALSKAEQVIFENKLLHKLFFEEIVWTEDKEKAKKSGLYLKTMELKPSQQFALRFFRYWPIISIFNWLGLSKSIARENAASYSSTALMAIILVENRDEAFFDAGRLGEYIWLTAVGIGLSGHLLTGVPFFWQRIKSDEAKEFSLKHIAIIKEAYASIASIAEAKDNEIASFVLRIGHGETPTARSSRRSLQYSNS